MISLATQVNERFGKFKNPFKSKALFFLVGVWFAIVGFNYVDVIPNDDYVVISQCLAVLAIFGYLFESKKP
ncbi:hypothetical protein WCD96_14335 [Proteus mirabilis]|uniref:hypothetical protein n=1 Tax=Proteus mirabilis TaxID=584 RepID=UPI001ABE2FE2